MNPDELARQLVSLPLADRVEPAQIPWESIDTPPADSVPMGDEDLLDQAERRDADLASGRVVGRTHAEVMAAARRALECE